MCEWIKYGDDLIETLRLPNFGYDVDIARDNRRFVVGEPSSSSGFFSSPFGAGNSGLVGVGTVRIYDSDLNQIGQTIAGTDNDFERLGHSVAINDAGDLVAAATGRAGGPNLVKMYEFDGTNWVKLAELPGVDGDDLPLNIGTQRVAMDGTGTYLVVSNPNAFNDQQGQVRVYERTGPAAWTEINLFTGGPNDTYGASVDFSPDGVLLAIGANGRVDIYKLDSGSYVYWTTISDPDIGFGGSVSLTQNNGDTYYVATGTSIGNAGPEVKVYSVDANVAGSAFLFFVGGFATISSNFSIPVALDYAIDQNQLILTVGDVAFNNLDGRTQTYRYDFSNPPVLLNTTNGNAESVNGFGLAQTYDPQQEPQLFFVSGSISDTLCGNLIGSTNVVTSSNFFQELFLFANVTLPGVGDYGDFGRSISLTDDGLTMIIGLPSAAGNRGAALFMTYDPNTKNWIPALNSTVVIGDDPIVETNLGKIVEISGDGQFVAVGGNDKIIISAKSGNTYTPSFEYNLVDSPIAISLTTNGLLMAVADTTNTTLVYNTITTTPIGGPIIPVSGTKVKGDVALSGDGSRMAILTEYQDGLDLKRRLDTYSIDGSTLSNLVLGVPIPEIGVVGSTVDMNEDGSRMAVGLVGGFGESLVRVFEYNEGNNTWVPVQNDITDFPSTTTGIEVVMSNDGKRVGVNYYSVNGGFNVARVYEEGKNIFDQTWQLLGDAQTDSAIQKDQCERMFDMSGEGNVFAFGVPPLENMETCTQGRVSAFEFVLRDETVKKINSYWTGVLNGKC